MAPCHSKAHEVVRGTPTDCKIKIAHHSDLGIFSWHSPSTIPKHHCQRTGRNPAPNTALWPVCSPVFAGLRASRLIKSIIYIEIPFKFVFLMPNCVRPHEWAFFLFFGLVLIVN